MLRRQPTYVIIVICENVICCVWLHCMCVWWCCYKRSAIATVEVRHFQGVAIFSRCFLLIRHFQILQIQRPQTNGVEHCSIMRLTPGEVHGGAYPYVQDVPAHIRQDDEQCPNHQPPTILPAQFPLSHRSLSASNVVNGLPFERHLALYSLLKASPALPWYRRVVMVAGHTQSVEVVLWFDVHVVVLRPQPLTTWCYLHLQA